MRLIDADALYEKVQHDEELARNRVLDTESTLPYPNNLNPSYTRYVAQMDERTRLKFMIADAQTIVPERKKGRWAEFDSDEDKFDIIKCSCCKHTFTVDSYHWTDIGFVKDDFNFCPNCGADMRGEQE